MEERIIRFISTLRSSGVRVSLAESADAALAISRLGIKDRRIFRLSLQATLIKDAVNLPIFDELFDIFFGSEEYPPLSNLTDDLTPEEARMLAQALQQFNEQIRQILKRLIAGKMLDREELDRLGKLVGLNQMDNLRYREWMAQRMLRAMRYREVRQAMEELATLLAQLGMDKRRVQALNAILQSNYQAQENQLRQFAGERIARNMSHNTKEDNVNSLMDKPFNSLSEEEMERLRKEVRRLAAILKTRVALRQKRAKSGNLDAKATIRTNLKHGNIPIQLRYRQRTLKPKLVVLCDVSTSMRYCSELMLSLLFHLQELINKTHAFAFIDRLNYISPVFTGREAVAAVVRVLGNMPSGYYNTDLGASLLDFKREFLNTVDNRTTFIIVGDGRNNFNDPQLALFNFIARRSQRMIWINPEPPAFWGSGDSDMLKYAPYCGTILQAATLAQLTKAIDRLLQ